MARLVRIPTGYGAAFRAKKPEALRVQSTSPFVDVNAQDIMNMITIADKVGKSEAINAAIGGIGEGIEYIIDSVTGEKVPVKKDTVDKVDAGAAVGEPVTEEPLKELNLIDDPIPTQPGATPPSAPVPAGGVPPTPPPPAGQVQIQEAARQRAAMTRAPRRGVEDVVAVEEKVTVEPSRPRRPIDTGRKVERRLVRNPAVRPGLSAPPLIYEDQLKRNPQGYIYESEGSTTIVPAPTPPGAPRQPAPPQPPPPPTPRDVPGPETTRGVPARRSIDVSRPTAKGMRTAALRAATAAGEQAAREVARETPVDPMQRLQAFIDRNRQKQQPVKQIAARPPEKELTFKEFQSQMPKVAPLVIPEKVSYRQLIALSRRARTPEDQANIINAYERASGKSRPRTLVERYNRAHEQRDIDRLTKLFPAARREQSAADQYYKLKRAQLQEAMAGSQRAKQQLLQERAQLTATQEQDLRRRIEAGSPEAKVAYQFALAQQAMATAGTQEEKARRTRELLELEKAAIAATTAEKLAAMYKKLKMARGSGRGRRSHKPLTDAQEAQVKYKAQQDSIVAQRQMINRIKQKINNRIKFQNTVNTLTDQYIRRFPPESQGALVQQRIRAQAELAALQADPEASTGTLQTATAVLRSMQSKSAQELNDIISRKAAVAAPPQSVPPTNPVQGAREQ